MNNKQWTYVLAIVVLVLVTVLRLFDKITDALLIQIFLLIIGALITGAVMYSLGKYHGFKEGSVSIG
ncbi:hypothetical protein ES702_07617 [subsurface metagenome]